MGSTDRFNAELLADGTPGDLTDLAEIERYADAVAGFGEGRIPEYRFTAAPAAGLLRPAAERHQHASRCQAVSLQLPIPRISL